MQGKILDVGIISAKDGVRYRFDVEDVKNLNNKPIDSLIGAEVDFEIVDGFAKEIYITKTQFSLDVLKQDDIKSIKLKVYISIATGILSSVPTIGFMFSIVSIVAMVFALISIKKVTGSNTILKNYILMSVCLLAGYMIVIFAIIPAIAFGVNGSSIGFIPIAIGLVLFVYGFIVGIKYYKELTKLSGDPFFIYSFWLLVAGYLTLVFGIGYLFILASFVLQLIAWVRLKELKSY
ncbi:hypothetical protein [Campylobacter sp. RM16190]|uniref:hypothetical protein n=1 Tax=Campylobacter sp. RM16190 TaxID=1705727 RepID=UPI001473113E|nr:hypothetical protein [Campylobacter sp. RM16190]